MARLTRHDAAVKIADLQRAVARMRDLQSYLARVEKPAMNADERRARVGRSHELARIETMVRELAEGMQATHAHPEVSGTRDTSAAALAAALPKASGQREKLLASMTRNATYYQGTSAYGLTDVQLAGGTGLTLNSVRPRRGELVAQGWLEDSGERRQHNGRDHIVWRLTDAGRLRLQTGDTET